jgi:hypothetical protein
MIPFPDIIQRSEAWEEMRRIRATASNAHRVITAVKGDLSKSAYDYAVELATATLFDKNPDPVKFMGNAHTDIGNEREEASRLDFTKRTGLAVEELGFMTTNDLLIGASPDGMIRGPDGAYIAGLEIKNPMSTTHAKYRLAGVLPDEYRAQVHTSLYVSGLDVWHFWSSFPSLEPMHVVVRRDEYTDKVAKAWDDFRILYAQTRPEVVKKLRPDLAP